MASVVEKFYRQGQSIWCDNLSRNMIDSGELQRRIDAGVVGVTSNPTIFMKAITGSADYDAPFDRLLGEGLGTQAIYEGLVLPDVADAADLLRPVYDRTDRVDGYVSLEVSPSLAFDTKGTIAEAKRLHAALNRRNVLIKVPATEEGMPAIEALIAEGISINVTLIFSLTMYEKVMRAYLDGLTRLDENGGDLGEVASVASFFVSRVDTLIDSLLEDRPSAGEIDHLLGRAAIANAKLAYARFEEVFAETGDFGALAAKGARVQRPLWASTSTKNPAYSPTMYVDGLMAPRTVNTLPPATIDAMTGSNLPTCTIRDDLAGCRALFDELKSQGIDIDEVTGKLLKDGVALFAQSFDELLANLERKRKQVRAAG